MIVMMGYRDADLLSGLLAYQTPVAVSSYIMAQQAGADGQLAGQLVVFSSVLSIFTLFVTILILRTIGLAWDLIQKGTMTRTCIKSRKPFLFRFRRAGNTKASKLC